MADPFAGAAWWITGHALARWQERYQPEAVHGDAARTLVTVSREAQETGVETWDGRPIQWHPA